MEISDDAIHDAENRMAERLASGPHAVAARYDRRVSRIMVTSSNGLELAFPPYLAEGLAEAKPADLAVIESTPGRVGAALAEARRGFVFAGTASGRVRVAAMDGGTVRP